MSKRTGIVEKVGERYLTVKLHHTGQIVEKVVKTSSLNLDEREQKPKIKIGTEILMDEDDYGTLYATHSISQGISLSEKEVSRIENAFVQIYGADIKLMSASGDNTETVEKIANKIDMWTTQFTVRNDATNLIQLLMDLAQCIADTTPDGGSSKDKPNKEKSNALAIKSKIEEYL